MRRAHIHPNSTQSMLAGVHEPIPLPQLGSAGMMPDKGIVEPATAARVRWMTWMQDGLKFGPVSS